MKISKDHYYITDETTDVNIDKVKELLSHSYWAENRPLDVIKKSIENSVCFSLYKADLQIGFARVVTDYSTFGYLADVIVEEEQRGNGLGKWLVETIVNDKRWDGKLLMLATLDAQGLYAKYGFKNSERLMGKSRHLG